MSSSSAGRHKKEIIKILNISNNPIALGKISCESKNTGRKDYFNHSEYNHLQAQK